MPKRWPDLPLANPAHDLWCDCTSTPPLRDTPPHKPADQRGRVSPPVCKHGEGSCEDCGTTTRRDAIHTTRGGVGVVGRLFKKRP